MSPIPVQCGCGRSYGQVHAKPRLRFRCHCTQCQSVYGADYSDAVVLRRGQFVVSPDTDLDWVRTIRPSPLIRGLCPGCRRPVLAHFWGVFSIIPVALLPEDVLRPVDHDVYYGTHRQPMRDTVPKHETALSSYLALSLPFLAVLSGCARPVD